MSRSLWKMSLRLLAQKISPCLGISRSIQVTQTRWKFKFPDTPDPDPEVHTKWRNPNPEKPKYPGEFDIEEPKGNIYDKKPLKIELEAGKMYSWCTCGFSHKQPFCDGSHKRAEGTHFKKFQPQFKPHRFRVEDTKVYWLCNCKQTDNRPFCDGTHKREDIQEKVKS